MSETESEIQRVQGLMADWRGTRKRSRPIPKELWEEAHQLSKKIGPSKTCELLRLNAGGLKRHRESKENSEQSPSKLTFTEIPRKRPSPTMPSVKLQLTGVTRSITIAFESIDEETLINLVPRLLD